MAKDHKKPEIIDQEEATNQEIPGKHFKDKPVKRPQRPLRQSSAPPKGPCFRR